MGKGEVMAKKIKTVDCSDMKKMYQMQVTGGKGKSRTPVIKNTKRPAFRKI
jgi:hypothetical protein